jgi:hypothetical protein
MNLHDVLAPLVAILDRQRIAYAVIGGYAVAAWGELRATRDVDLYCNAGDLGVLKRALQSAALCFEHRVGDSEDPISDVIRIEAGSGDTVF